MIYKWREKRPDGTRIWKSADIDPVKLWGEFVEFDRGENFAGPFLRLVQCPNPKHNTRKRHFQINVERPLVHCFAECGISGSYEHAIMTMEGCTQREARAVILKAKTGRVSTTSGNRKQLPDKGRLRKHRAAGPDDVDLGDDIIAAYRFLPRAAREYLDSRGIADESRARWEIGYDEATSRIVFPARDMRGVTRFLTKRSIIGERPPYLNEPKESHKTALLYGACYANREQIRSTGLVLVEGVIDTIRLHQHGIPIAAGILGATLNDRQVGIIQEMRPRKVWLFFDCDGAGVSATLKAGEVLRRKYPLMVVRYRGEATDPASMTGREVSEAIDRAIPYAEFLRRIKRPKPERSSRRKEMKLA